MQFRDKVYCKHYAKSKCQEQNRTERGIEVMLCWLVKENLATIMN